MNNVDISYGWVVVDCWDTKPRVLKKDQKNNGDTIIKFGGDGQAGAYKRTRTFLLILKRVEDLMLVRMIMSQQEAKQLL